MTPTSGNYKLIIHVNISQINEGLDAIGNKISNSTNEMLEQLSFGLNPQGLKSPAPTAKRLFEQFHESQILGSQLTNWPRFRNEFAQRVITKRNSLLVEVQLAEKVLNSIRSLMQVKRNKIPRSLIPGLGNIIGYVAGLATDSQVQEVQEQLKDIKKTNDKVSHFLTSATSIIHSLEQDVVRVQEDTFNIVNETLLAFQKSIMDNQKEIVSNLVFGVASLQTNLERVAWHLTAEIRNLQHRLYEILHAVMTTSLKGFPVQLLDPSDLSQILTNIVQSLPNPYALAISSNENLLDLVKIVKCELMSTSEQLIVVCYLPLNRIGSEFNLYETISVPYRISDSQHYIKTQPSSDFFAVTNDADSYLLLNRYDLEFNCVSYKQKTICDSHIVLRKASFKSCSYAAFTEDTSAINQLCERKKESQPDASEGSKKP
ncbi:hypothetical protein QYM36_018985 [Artemia franciscana]|uniref:Uncharacterized protein n=1 Tax=Artemia franciscana TaxID=6661 RepID=A0AA88KTF6_ARTSF|nr:hypothetical protein QYM36_018985 [Artemia franciscana]